MPRQPRLPLVKLAMYLVRLVSTLEEEARSQRVGLKVLGEGKMVGLRWIRGE